VEARRMIIEDSSGTIADQRLVGVLIEKWNDLMEGMGDDTPFDRYKRGCLAMLFENQARDLRRMNEETRALNVGYFTKFIFPVLTRVFPNLIANEIVSVQPMTAPQGAVFYLDYIYGTSKGAVTAGEVFPRDFNQNYTSEYVDGEVLVTGDGTNYGPAATALSANLAFTPVHKPSTDRGIQVIIREIDASDGSTVQEGKFLATGAADTSTDLSAGTLNYSNGALAGVRFGTIPVNGNQVKMYYRYDGELNTLLPRMKLDVKKAVIQVESRRLKALWSSEAAEDLRALQGIEAETELVSAAAQEMALEIDREIITDLFLASTGTTDTFDRVPPAGISEVDHLRSIVTSFSRVSNAIHKATLRAPANWIVTSPEISALIEQLTTHGDFRPIWVTGPQYGAPLDMPRPMTHHGQFGVYKQGTLMHKWIVYIDPFFQSDMALVGLKGSSYLDSGYVWAPYVPLQVTPTFLDPNDMSFRKGLRTRYAKKLLRSEYYGQLRVQNL